MLCRFLIARQAKTTCAEEQLQWMKCFDRIGRMGCAAEWDAYNNCHSKAKMMFHAVRAAQTFADSPGSKQERLMIEDSRRQESTDYYSFDYWHAVFPSSLIPNWKELAARWKASHRKPS